MLSRQRVNLRLFGNTLDMPRERKEAGKAVCKFCGGKVERGSGTTNLKQHLCTWHRVEHDKVYPETLMIQTPSPKQGTMDSYLNRVEKTVT